MLLVAKDFVPQQMNLRHLNAVTQFLRACSYSAFFNSWCGAASVNHFHVQLIDELPPVAQLPLIPGPLVQGQRCQMPKGFPGSCYVFDAVSQISIVDVAVRAMQADNQPHNIVFTPPIDGCSSLIYMFPKPYAFPRRTFDLYPYEVGSPELLGCFTLYTQHDFDAFSSEDADELVRINTAQLPLTATDAYYSKWFIDLNSRL